MTMVDDARAANLGFEHIGLHVGSTLFIRPLDPQQAPQRHQVEYIGSLRGKTLVVTLPVVDGKGLWMPGGQDYVFHVVAGMYVYGFTSRVLRARSSPVPHVHFAWPGRIDARQVRKSYRVKMRQTVTANRGGEARECLLLDLSMTGAMLETDDSGWREDDRIDLTLPIALDEISSCLNLVATVRNREERQSGKGFRCGVEFAGVAEHDAMLLHYYIDHALAQRIG